MATAAIPSVTFRRTESRREFVAAMNGGSRSGYLSPIYAGEFTAADSYLSDCGTIGFRVTRDGDLQSVFNNSAVKGAGAAAVLCAIRNGARTLDCFDGFLPAYYRRFGFIEVERVEWNDDYAPADWNYERDGRPDVVYMRFHGGNPANLADRLAVGAII